MLGPRVRRLIYKIPRCGAVEQLIDYPLECLRIIVKHDVCTADATVDDP